jgi:hypothetical protein
MKQLLIIVLVLSSWLYSIGQVESPMKEIYYDTVLFEDVQLEKKVILYNDDFTLAYVVHYDTAVVDWREGIDIYQSKVHFAVLNRWTRVFKVVNERLQVIYYYPVRDGQIYRHRE